MQLPIPWYLPMGLVSNTGYPWYMGKRVIAVPDDVYSKLAEIRKQRTVDNGGNPVTFAQVIAGLLGDDWNFLLADQPTGTDARSG